MSRWHRLCLATPNPTKYPSPLAIKQCWVKGTSDLSFLLSLFLSLPNQAESPKAQQERLKKKAGATTATLKDDLSQPNSDHTQPKNRLRTSAQPPPPTLGLKAISHFPDIGEIALKGASGMAIARTRKSRTACLSQIINLLPDRTLTPPLSRTACQSVIDPQKPQRKKNKT